MRPEACWPTERTVMTKATAGRHLYRDRVVNVEYYVDYTLLYIL